MDILLVTINFPLLTNPLGFKRYTHKIIVLTIIHTASDKLNFVWIALHHVFCILRTGTLVETINIQN